MISVALLASLAVLTGLSFFWTNNEGLAYEKTVQMTCILGLFVMALLCSRPGSARGWLVGMAVGLSFLVLLAALSRFIPSIGDDQELRESLYGSAGRLSWPLGYWNAMGAIAAMATILVGWFAATLANVRRRIACIALLPTFFLVLYLTSSRGALASLIFGSALLFLMDRHRKGLLIAYGAGLAGGAILVVVSAQMNDLVHADAGSTARTEGMALLALTIVVTAALVLLLRSNERSLKDKPLPRLPTPAWIVVGLLAVAGLIAANPVKQTDNFISTPQTNRDSGADPNDSTLRLLSTGGNGRWQYWSVAAEAFGDEPVKGIGAGGFQNYYTNHRDNLLFGRHTHSLPLRYLAELGLVGFLIGAAFMLSVLLIAWRRWNTDRGFSRRPDAVVRPTDPPLLTEMMPPFAAIVLAGMVSMSIDWTSEFPVVAAPILISMAALIGPATRRTPEPAAVTDRQVGRGLIPRELPSVFAIVFAGAAILVSVYGFGISEQIEQSRQALRDGDTEKALKEAEDAVGLAPWSEASLMQLAGAEEASGNDIAALNALDRAAGQAPLDSAPWLAKLRIAGRLNDSVEAAKALVEASRLDPHAPPFENPGP